MNEYTFNQLYIGMQESFECKITEEMMERFWANTGDENPLHHDREFAVAHGFSDCVVYGMLSASFISTLGGVYLPGKYCIIQQVEAKFTSPVYVGDTLRVVGTVQELNESVQQSVIKVEMLSSGKKVLRGKLYVGFLE